MRRIVAGALCASASHVGIERQVTVARTPQQNGVAERANRTIMEAARSMLHATGLPSSF